MNMIKKYYQRVDNATHHKSIEIINTIERPISKIIELGCGNGRDTIYLLRERI